ncbi:MAG: NBR1-Ig-like domain-containing protein [Chloroflexota bacterium]
MKNTGKKYILAVLVVLFTLVLNACGPSTPEPTPTLSMGEIQTLAVVTFSVGLTQTALALPTETPTPTPTETPTATSTPKTTLTSGSGIVQTASCNGLTGVRDVTIPDNTPMTAGQTFTKTWLVKNTGTCTWDIGFKFAFTGGEAMSGVTLVLDKSVLPGAEIELSVPMTAPTGKTGSVRGNWRMSTANGVFFGDEQFVIIVLGGATGTVTATGTPATATPTGTLDTATPTGTPPTETPSPTP